MKYGSLILFSTIASSALADPVGPPAKAELDRAYVTIPYSELRALWEAGQAKPDSGKPEAAPMPSVVHRIECELKLGEMASALTAKVEVETFDAGWQTIPLIGGTVQLEDADAGPRTVVVRDGVYALLGNQAGKTPVTLQLSAPGTKDSRTPLTLELGNATVKRLRIAGVPAGMEARVNGRGSSEVKDGIAVFALAGGAGELKITVEAPKVEAPAKPSKWQAQSQVLVRPGESRLLFQSQVSAHADEGSGLEMTLGLPANASGIAVTGTDIAEWTQARADDGRRSILIRWQTRDVLDREFIVAFSTPLSPMAEEWQLQAPALAEQNTMRTLYAIVPSDGLELKGDGVRAGIDSRRLPEWMRKEVGGAAFVTVESQAPLALQTHWLPAVATAEAIVAESKCTLRLVADGAMQTTAGYLVRHAAPLVWRLELPANVELLSCSVGGRPARPVQREAGVFELNLSTPDDKGVTPIGLVYTSKAKALDPVSGEIALELPRTGLFIERIDWAIDLPEPYEITAVDGNLSVVPAADTRADGRLLALRKEFCRGERPSVALFYQRRSAQ